MTFGDAAYYRKMWLLARERAEQAEARAEKLAAALIEQRGLAEIRAGMSSNDVETLETLRRRNEVQSRTIAEVQEALNLSTGEFNCQELAPRIRDLKKQLAAVEARHGVGGPVQATHPTTGSAGAARKPCGARYCGKHERCETLCWTAAELHGRCYWTDVCSGWRDHT